MNQLHVNKVLWDICTNFKNKTEIKQNYIEYISALLYIKYYDEEYSRRYSELYNTKDNYYVSKNIDESIEYIRQDSNDRNIFVNVRFENVKTFRDIGEENILTKTIEDIYKLTRQVKDRNSIANAYEYALREAAHNNDIVKTNREFYTPSEITELMSDIVMHKKVMSENTTLYDPICGSGNFLRSALKKYNLNIYGKETNIDYYNICKTRMLLNGINKDNIVFGIDNRNMNFDIILSNPPFSDKMWKENIDIERIYKFGNLNTINGDYAYVLSMLETLNDNGKMAVILPHGVLFRENEKQIRRELLAQKCIETIIGLPENLFYSTRIPVIILVMSKNRGNDDVLFIDASEDYESLKSNNILSKENQNKILQAYIKRKDIEEYSHLASIQEIEKNDYNLSIKKYIHKKSIRNNVEREKLIQTLKNTEKEKNILEENIKDVLEVLGYKDIVELQQISKEDTDYVIDYEKIGANLRMERINKELTLHKLSQIVELSPRYISRLEMGLSAVRLETLARLCNALDISVSKLLK